MQYELLYIVPTSFTDEDVGQVEGNVKALLEKYGATVNEASRLGKFRFAYPIKKARHGHYILVKLTAEPTSIAKMDEALRISNDVLRHLLLRSDEVGSDKFDLVQFVEVTIETKDDRARRRRDEADAKGDAKPKSADDIKSVAADLEKKPEDVAAPVVALSDEELDKKLDAAIPNL